jgi:hypothetical protein
VTTANPELASILARLAQALADPPPEQPAVPASRPMPERILLTVEETAERLGIGRTTAWGLSGPASLSRCRLAGCGAFRRRPFTTTPHDC